jgi:curved DNA-binding protein CbpA
MKDYYRTLGILDDAEDIIVKAAYRALAQRYHPDKWVGDQSDATKRMAEINEAYGVLSDPIKREKYDKELYMYKARNDSSEDDSGESINEDLGEIDEAWQLAVEFFPSIQSEFEELRKINLLLANTYKTALVESQGFKNSKVFKKKYETEYLTRYYGSNQFVRNLAKFLLSHSEQKAAAKVNKLVRLLGESLTYTQIFDKIHSEFSQIECFKKSIYFDAKFERNLDYIIRKVHDSYPSNEEISYLIGKSLKSEVSVYKFSSFDMKNEYPFEISQNGELKKYTYEQAHEMLKRLLPLGN